MTATTSNRAGRPATFVLGRYRTSAEARILYARRKGSWTYITDEPVTVGNGKVYPVEEIPDGDGAGAVEALATDYLSEAKRSRSIPMAHTIIDVPDLAVAA